MKWLALTIVIVSALAARGFAQSDQFVADAEALAKKGDFVGAAAKFKAAYAVDPRPALICNVGVAYYKAKDLPRAHLFLNRCLERGTALDPKFVDSVRAVIKAVESSLRSGNFTPLDIVVEPAGATVIVHPFGEDEVIIGSHVVWVPSGKHEVVGRNEDYEDNVTEVDAKGHDLQPVHITLVHKPVVVGPGNEHHGEGVGSDTTGSGSGSGAPPPPSGSGSATITPTPPTPHLTHRYTTPSKVPAIASTAITAVALAITIVAYSNAHDSADRSQFALSSDAYKSDVSSVDHWNALMGASMTLTVIGAGVSGYLWSRAFQTERVDVQPTSNGVAFRFSTRW